MIYHDLKIWASLTIIGPSELDPLSHPGWDSFTPGSLHRRRFGSERVGSYDPSRAAARASWFAQEALELVRSELEVVAKAVSTGGKS